MPNIITCEQIEAAVAGLCQEANFFLGEDVLQALKKGLDQEESPTGKEVLRQVLANFAIASEEQVPICQDTGLTVVFLEMGQDVRITGGYLYEAINRGVSRGYREGYLRASMVGNPISRKNTGDNTPAIIHTTIIPGEKLRITVAPKGGGSENMSAVAMLYPSAGIAGIKSFVLDTVRKAGANPCPPLVVGVGIGGDLEEVALLAKKALLRPLGEPSSMNDIAVLEKDLLTGINNLGIGPGGLGGRITALAVHIEVFACHIASLPVAVNLNCHAARHRSVTL